MIIFLWIISAIIGMILLDYSDVLKGCYKKRGFWKSFAIDDLVMHISGLLLGPILLIIGLVYVINEFLSHDFVKTPIYDMIKNVSRTSD